MEIEKLSLAEILRIPNAEVWSLRQGKSFPKDKGPLQVLYSKEQELFVLKINKFQFALDKSLQTIESYSEKDRYFSYMLPISEGFYIIKLINVEPSSLTCNFETILENTTRFLRKSGLEQELGSDHGVEKIIELPGESKETDKVAQDLDFNSIKTFQDLQEIGEHTQYAEIPMSDIQNLKQETADIIKNHQDMKQYKDDDSAFELKSWGSNITNPSETAANLETDLSRLSSISEKDAENPFPVNINPPTKTMNLTRNNKPAQGSTIEQERDVSNNP